MICMFCFLPAANVAGQSNPALGGFDAPGFLEDAFSGMDKAFEEMETGVTPQDAYFLGRAIAANILTAYSPYTGNPELTRYLNRICQAIVINSPGLELYQGCSVQILDNPEYNAFASPGGHIFITRGLVEAAASEDQLAAVIAHELAHIILKHGLNMISEMRIVDEAAATANRAAELAGNSEAARRTLEFRSSVSTMFDTMVKNGYSQAQEFEADREALKLLAASGYDPEALLQVLIILHGTQSSQQGGFFSTHPSPVDRFVNAEKWIGDYQVNDTRSYRAPRFKNK